MDICLVNMPYAPVRVPSIALGILQAILEKDGFSVSSLYPNIRFASEIGVREYSRLWMILRSENAIAEWTFSHIAFPEYATNAEQFLNLLDERNSNFLDLPDPVGRLLTVREKASRFIDDFVDQVLTLNPRVIGCTSTFFQHVSSLALLRKVKKIDPTVITLMGGGNCESVMGMTTHKVFGWVDYVVSGEAEDIISDLCGKLLTQGLDVATDEIPFGVFGPAHRQSGYPCEDDLCNSNAPRAVTADLDKHPVPNYDDYFYALNQTPDVCREIKPGILAEASRGCWWQINDGCSFCGLNGAGRRYRRKSTATILDEFESMSNRHGVNRFEMVDNVLHPGFIKTLIPELIKLGSPYDIFFEIRPGLERADFEKLGQAGVIWIQPGIESLHSNVLKLMNKGSESWQNIQMLKWSSQLGIRCSWILMHGLPGEDDRWYEEMAEYLPHVFHLQAPRSLTRVRYVRFSHYHNNPNRYGLKLSPAKPFSLVYPVAESDLNDLVYYFDEEEQLRLQQAPIISDVFLRPGLLKTRKVQQDWIRAQDSESPPVVIMETNEDRLLITDTRPLSKKRELVMSGLEKDVYLACDEAPKQDELLERFRRKGFDSGEIMAILDRHTDQSVTLHVDGRYVSLALRHPVKPLRPFHDFPGGYLVPIV